MSKNTAAKTVRMFDGTAWDTYKVGSKKHRAAEARRAEFDATKAATQNARQTVAKEARAVGIVPAASAWALIRENGYSLEGLSVKALLKANKADGLVLKANKAKAEVAIAAEPEVAKAAKPVGRKARRKARSAAAKKGWETRRANAAKVAEVEVVEAKPAKAPKKAKKAKAAKVQVVAPVAMDEEFVAQLSAAGFTQEQIERAWALKA